MKNKRLFVAILAGIILVLAVALTLPFLSRPDPAAVSATALVEVVQTAFPLTATVRAGWTRTPTASPVPTATAVVTATAAPLYQEDFSDPGSGWSTNSWDGGQVGYSDGKYQLTVISTMYDVWSFKGRSYTNAVYSTDISVVAPTGKGAYGIICRLQDDENFYALEVSEAGFFTIWKKIDGDNIALYDWEYSEAIPLDEPITLQAVCAGSQLSLSVNDVLLATVQDDSFKTGKIGLIASTDDTGNLTVAFDNFEVNRP